MKIILALAGALVGGIAFNILYNRYNPIEYREKKKDLLYDASHNKSRKCHCEQEYCTCGKHIL